jgi:SAM-dependent methyltransferase
MCKRGIKQAKKLERMRPYDYVHPEHRGPNTVQMTRLQVADLIRAAGHRYVLDVPSGTGALTQLLVDRGIEVVSADLHPEYFVSPNRTCVPADLNARLPFNDAQFDACACIEGIEHIESPHHFAREANRILRVGGKVYITTPNILSIRSRISYLLRGYPNQFHYMIEIDPLTGSEQAIAHINPIGFLELRYVLSRWGFQVDVLQTNRMKTKHSLFYQLIRFLLLTKGKRAAASHPYVAEVRQMLLSDAVLFGEGLIIGATKVADSGQ